MPRRLIYVAGKDGPDVAQVLEDLGGVADLRVLSVMLGDVDPDLRKAAQAQGELIVVSDVDEIRGLADALEDEWLGAPVMAFSDDVLLPAVELGNALGWWGMDAAVVATARHKHQARDLFSSAGLPTPLHASIATLDDVGPACARVGFPAVLKPVFGAGSTWVSRVDSPAEVEERLSQAWSEMENDEYVARSSMKSDRTFVLESLLVGRDTTPHPALADYCSVEGVVVDGQVKVLGVADRFWPAPPFRETGVVFPSQLDTPTQTELAQHTVAAVQAVRMTSGAFHVEFKLTPAGPVMIEFNPRPGGPIPRLWTSNTDHSYVAAFAASLLSEADAFDVPLVRAGGEHLLYGAGDQSRVLAGVTGVSDVLAIPGVTKVDVWHEVGDVLHVYEGDYSAVVRAWSSAASPELVVEVDQELRRTVRFDLEGVPS